MKKELKEDMLIVKPNIANVPQPKKIVSEDLGDLYSNSDIENLYDPPEDPDKKLSSLGLSLGNDQYTITITQGDKSYSVASDKFVVLTKNCLAAMTSDIEQLKKLVISNERKISKFNSAVKTINELKAEINKLKSRTPIGLFKDGN